ncbi:MAG: hypothetical protein ACXWJW_16380 [Xanthobacteraceae bacterium]
MDRSQHRHACRHGFVALAAAVTTLAAVEAFAQAKPSPEAATPPSGQAAPQQGLAPPKAYKPLAVRPPKPVEDPTFEQFRKQLADVVNRKDRAALQKMVVAQGFFWEAETGDKASKRKSSFENFATAVGLNDKSGSGWDIIATAAGEPSLEPADGRKGVQCGPANPQIDEKAFEDLIKATATDAEEWGFPHAAGLEMRAAPKPDAPVIEKLGVHLVRVLPDDDSAGAQPSSMMRVVGPSGKVGYVANNALLPIVFDQLCYTKETGGWKIAGYVGGE